MALASPPPLDDSVPPPEPLPETTPRTGLGLMAGVVALIVAGFLLLDLLLQNGHTATLHFLWMHAHMSLAALVVGSALMAVVIDEAVGLVWRRRRRRLLNLEEHR